MNSPEQRMEQPVRISRYDGFYVRVRFPQWVEREHFYKTIAKIKSLGGTYHPDTREWTLTKPAYLELKQGDGTEAPRTQLPLSKKEARQKPPSLEDMKELLVYGRFKRGHQIYFIQGDCECSSLIKIGTSTDVPKRFKSMQSMSPVPLKLLVVVGGTQREERMLHKIFEGSHAYGEWFKPSGQLTCFIESLKKEVEKVDQPLSKLQSV